MYSFRQTSTNSMFHAESSLWHILSYMATTPPGMVASDAFSAWAGLYEPCLNENGIFDDCALRYPDNRSN